MTTPLRSYNDRKVRSAIINLVEIDNDNRVLVMPRSIEYSLDNGLAEDQPIEDLDNRGFKTLVAHNYQARMPKVQLTFAGSSLDTTALSIDQQTEMVTVNLKYPHRQQVVKSNYAPAGDGFIGSEITQDVETFGSYHDPITKQTLKLTQQFYGNFNPSIPKSFAIGPKFERLYSNDLVQGRLFVTLIPEGEFLARGLSEKPVGFLRLTGLCFNADNRLSILSVPTCFVNPEGGGLKSENTTVNLDVPGQSACQPWNIFEINKQSFCEN